VKPSPFAYAKAKSLDHAIELLSHPEARLLAGGQSLMATLNMRLSAPKLLIDLNGIGGLSGIVVRNRTVEIGAMTPHIGHAAIRNRGTLGGSIAFADPAAELPACLLALDGEVEIAGQTSKRAVKADDFFKGLFETALGPHDVLTAIRLPAATTQTRVGFAEFARRHGDYAMVGLAAAAKADGQALSDVRLAYFGVGNTPVRAKGAEAALAGGGIDEAVKALASDLDPAADVQATAATKMHLASVLLRRVTQQLMEARP